MNASARPSTTSRRQDWNQANSWMSTKPTKPKKTNRNEIDFDDILLITCHLIESDEDVAASIRSGITWLTVDEYQDVSPLQHRLLKIGRAHV